MSRRPNKCATEDCTNMTNGIRCRSCATTHKKSAVTPQQYRREWSMKSKYGMDEAEFHGRWITFRGKCGICGCDMKMPEYKRGQALDVVAIDHNHITGQVRGLLCNSCNKGLGFFKDNIDNLKSALRWLGEKVS